GLHLLGIELDDHPLADVDPRLLEQRDVGRLAPLPLPDEIEPVVPLAAAEAFRGGRARDVRDVGELALARDAGDLGAEGVEGPAAATQKPGWGRRSGGASRRRATRR